MGKLSSSTTLKSHPEHGTISSTFAMSNWTNEEMEANLLAMHQAIVDGKPSKVDGITECLFIQLSNQFYSIFVLVSWEVGGEYCHLCLPYSRIYSSKKTV